jgi:hypothetical protein
MNNGQTNVNRFKNVLNTLWCFHSKIKLSMKCAYSMLHQCKNYVINSNHATIIKNCNAFSPC